MHPEALPTGDKPRANWPAILRPLLWSLATAIALAVPTLLLWLLSANAAALLVATAVLSLLLGAGICGGALLLGLQAGWRLSHHHAPAEAVRETVQAVAQGVASVPQAVQQVTGQAVSVGEEDEFMQEVERQKTLRHAMAAAELAALGKE